MAETKERLKYKLNLTLDGHSVGMKPFVLNLIGHICEAIFSELKGITEENLMEPISLCILPGTTFTDEDNKVDLQIGENSIYIKGWVQEMISFHTSWLYFIIKRYRTRT